MNHELTEKDFKDMTNELEYRDMIKDCIQVIEWFYFWSMALVSFRYQWRDE